MAALAQLLNKHNMGIQKEICFGHSQGSLLLALK